MASSSKPIAKPVLSASPQTRSTKKKITRTTRQSRSSSIEIVEPASQELTSSKGKGKERELKKKNGKSGARLMEDLPIGRKETKKRKIKGEEVEAAVPSPSKVKSLAASLTPAATISALEATAEGEAEVEINMMMEPEPEPELTGGQASSMDGAPVTNEEVQSSEMDKQKNVQHVTTAPAKLAQSDPTIQPTESSNSRSQPTILARSRSSSDVAAALLPNNLIQDSKLEFTKDLEVFKKEILDEQISWKAEFETMKAGVFIDFDQRIIATEKKYEQKVVEMENKQKSLELETSSTKAELESTKAELKSITTELASTKMELTSIKTVLETELNRGKMELEKKNAQNEESEKEIRDVVNELTNVTKQTVSGLTTLLKTTNEKFKSEAGALSGKIDGLVQKALQEQFGMQSTFEQQKASISTLSGKVASLEISSKQINTNLPNLKKTITESITKDWDNKWDSAKREIENTREVGKSLDRKLKEFTKQNGTIERKMGTMEEKIKNQNYERSPAVGPSNPTALASRRHNSTISNSSADSEATLKRISALEESQKLLRRTRENDDEQAKKLRDAHQTQINNFKDRVSAVEDSVGALERKN